MPTSAKSSIALIALAVSLLAGASAPLAPLFDPDEGYYPATAAETLRGGTFWDLSFNGEPRWEKPVLSYALIEASFVTFGESATAARIPSAIEAGLLILIVGALVTRLAGARAGVVSAITVGTTVGISIFSRAAHPELALVLCVIATELLICVWLSTSDVRAATCGDRRRGRDGTGAAGKRSSRRRAAAADTPVHVPADPMACRSRAITRPRCVAESRRRDGRCESMVCGHDRSPWPRVSPRGDLAAERRSRTRRQPLGTRAGCSRCSCRC